MALHLIRALEELGVGHELLHRADVDLARAEAGGADVGLQMLPVHRGCRRLK